MIRRISMTLALGLMGSGAFAQSTGVYVYFCEGGKVARSGIKFEIDEVRVSFNTANDLPPRPDYGRFPFVESNWLTTQGVARVTWERTSTMARICKDEQACNASSSGTAVATVAGPATAGAPSDAQQCEPDVTIQTARCTADGTLQTQQMTGTAAQIASMTGASADTAGGRVLYWPPASGAAPQWRDVSIETLREECSGTEKTSESFRDGTWQITLTGSEATDCPAQALAMAQSQMALANATRDVRWSSPANPADLLPETGNLGAWRGGGRNWQLHYEPPSNAGATPIKVDVDYGFAGRSATQIDITGHLQIRMDKSLAQIAGFGGHCIYDMTAVATHVAN